MGWVASSAVWRRAASPLGDVHRRRSGLGPGPGASALVLLGELSAPEPLLQWAGRFTCFEACWNACPAAGWLLWAAARTSQSCEERRAVVLCAAEVADLALDRAGWRDPRITTAIAQARAWAAGEGDPAATLATAQAGQAALEAAGDAAELATGEAARARRLMTLAPRQRLATAIASRALDARLASCRAARQESVALAAAWTAWAAAEAGTAADLPVQWAACVSQAGTHAATALSLLRPATGSKARARAAAPCAGLVRSRLPCPRIG
jgi:hypothetical protein